MEVAYPVILALIINSLLHIPEVLDLLDISHHQLINHQATTIQDLLQAVLVPLFQVLHFRVHLFQVQFFQAQVHQCMEQAQVQTQIMGQFIPLVGL